jgi:hypothetical protein
MAVFLCQLVEVIEPLTKVSREHPVECIGQELRGYVTTLNRRVKRIVEASK